jgi:hypothetical protein
MFTLIALAATTSFMTLAIITMGITVLSIKDLIVDAPESIHLQAPGFAQPSRAAIARCAA